MCVFRTKQDLFSFLLLCSVVVVVGRKTILIYPINTSYLFSFSSLSFFLLSRVIFSTNTNYNKFSPLSYRINFFLFSSFWPTTTAHKIYCFFFFGWVSVSQSNKYRNFGVKLLAFCLLISGNIFLRIIMTMLVSLTAQKYNKNWFKLEFFLSLLVRLTFFDT